ncbi:hypothetical protein FOZ76_20335 [Verticiella sediminum]|uniref:Uncharacterized protein n=1 Tax=Verticiella sediminum TaxID=1247510 RepID=A0A556ABC0_9BURK|nr:hypothetical protein [Verticiella sediminum]TSH90189.1 hypothetical protein FOZ76_20335 [Verticiella sediminum]
MDTYTIRLEDFPDISDKHRTEAESRFRRTLERALGGGAEVVPAYKAWQAAEETGEHELSTDDVALAKRWLAAASRARNDGFNGLGEAPEAYFEVKLAR